MKNSIKIILAAAALVSFAACETELTEVSSNERPTVTFTAGFAQSKTAMSTDGRSNVWTGTEKVSIFDGTANQEFTALAAGERTTLSGTADPDASEYYALLPYQANATFSEGTITASIPAKQTPVLGSYDPAAALAVAMSTDTNLEFKNVTALLKVKITADDIAIITISGNDGEDLAGDVNITIDEDGVPTAEVVPGTESKIVRITNQDGTALAPGTYYISILPVELVCGLTVSVTDINGHVGEKSGEDELIIWRNDVVSLGTINPTCEPVTNLYLRYTAGYDLLLGGREYNIADYGRATRVSSDTEITSEGVYFIDETATVTLGNTSAQAVQKCLIIGNDATKRPVCKMTDKQFFLGDQAELILANLYFNAINLTPSYPFPCNTNCTVKQLTFDNVWMNNCAKKPLGTWISGNKAYKSLSIVNSEFLVRGADVYIISVNTEEGATTYFTMDRILVRNSVIYSRGNIANNCRILQAPGLVTVNNLVMTDNTFININPNGGIINANTVWRADIENNLFFFNQNFNYRDALVKVSTQYPDDSKGNSICQHNLLYHSLVANEETGVNFFSIYFDNTKHGSVCEYVTKASSNPYDGGTFPADATARDASSLYVPNATYASYGAQR